MPTVGKVFTCTEYLGQLVKSKCGLVESEQANARYFKETKAFLAANLPVFVTNCVELCY